MEADLQAKLNHLVGTYESYGTWMETNEIMNEVLRKHLMPLHRDVVPVLWVHLDEGDPGRVNVTTDACRPWDMRERHGTLTVEVHPRSSNQPGGPEPSRGD